MSCCCLAIFVETDDDNDNHDNRDNHDNHGDRDDHDIRNHDDHDHDDSHDHDHDHDPRRGGGYFMPRVSPSVSSHWVVASHPV